MFFKNRISRRKYFILSLFFSILVSIVYFYHSYFDNIIKKIFINKYILLGLIVICWMYFTTKRVHDFGLTGHYVILAACYLYYYPIITFFFFLYVLFKEGNPEINEFGLPPVDYWNINDSFSNFKSIINFIKNWDN